MKELYDYPLTKENHILEIGGYHGAWSWEMHHRYGCRVTIFEPCFEYFKILRDRFNGNSAFTLYHAAVGGDYRLDKIRIKGDMAGFFADDGPYENVVVVPIKELLLQENFALIQVNAEGAEHDIVESIAWSWYSPPWLQIQWHTIPNDNGESRKRLEDHLSHVYDLAFSDKNSGWEGWKSKFK